MSSKLGEIVAKVGRLAQKVAAFLLSKQQNLARSPKLLRLHAPCSHYYPFSLLMAPWFAYFRRTDATSAPGLFLGGAT